MGTADQQFCLRWNNHQSTLVSVFDTLLESGTLVDCTLAAEGQYLKAHKVVLSACSPYFEALLSQHYEKHPIVILKDVKFQELKAMMDYMYRGEVNISQDQLGALLKAAESLQIKGLSDSGGGGTEPSEPKRQKTQQSAPPQTSRSPPPSLPRSSGLTIEHKKSQDIAVESPHVREGSASPLPRKRRRARRRSSGGDDTTQLEGHETSNSCEIPSVPSSTASIPSAVTPIAPPVAAPESQLSEEQAETDMNLCRSLPIADPMPVTMPHENIVSKTEPPTELIEPKTEYIEEPNEASVDLTMDDDDLDEDLDPAKPGTSHGGEGSSRQGIFEQWHMTERSSDEDFLNAQEAAQQAVASGAAGAAGPASHRDPQVETFPENEVGVYVSIEDMSIKEERVSPVTIENLFPCIKSNFKNKNDSRQIKANQTDEIPIRIRKKKSILPRSPNPKGMVRIPMDDEILSQIKNNEKMNNRLKLKLKKSMLAPLHKNTNSNKKLKKSHKKDSIIKKSFPQTLKPIKTKMNKFVKCKKIDTELNKVLASTVSSFISNENKNNDENNSKELIKTNTSTNTKLNKVLASTLSSFISKGEKFKIKKNDDNNLLTNTSANLIKRKSLKKNKEISKAKSSRNEKEPKISKSPSKTKDKKIIKKKKMLKNKKLSKNSKPPSKSFSDSLTEKSSPISSHPQQIIPPEITSSESSLNILGTISKKSKVTDLKDKEDLETTTRGKVIKIKEVSEELNSLTKTKIISKEKQDSSNLKSSSSLTNEDLSFEISQYLSNPINSSQNETSINSLPKDYEFQFSASLSNRPVSPQNKMNKLNLLSEDDSDSKASPTDPISTSPISQDSSMKSNIDSKDDTVSEKSNITSQDAHTSSNPPLSLSLQENKTQRNVPCNDENNKIDHSNSSHVIPSDLDSLPISAQNKSILIEHANKDTSHEIPADVNILSISTKNNSTLKDHIPTDEIGKIPTDLDALPISTKKKSTFKDNTTQVASCKISIDLGYLPMSTLNKSTLKDALTKEVSGKISSNLDPCSISTQNDSSLKDHTTEDASCELSIDSDSLPISAQSKFSLKDHTTEEPSGEFSICSDSLPIPIQNKPSLKDQTNKDRSNEISSNLDHLPISLQNTSSFKAHSIKDVSGEPITDSDPLPISIQNRPTLKDHIKEDASHEIPSNLDSLSISAQNRSTFKDPNTEEALYKIVSDPTTSKIYTHPTPTLKDHTTKEASCKIPIDDSGYLPISTLNKSKLKCQSSKEDNLNDSLIIKEGLSTPKSSYSLPKPLTSSSRLTNYPKLPVIPLSYFKENTPNILKKNILRKISNQSLLKKSQDDSTSRKSPLVNPIIGPELKKIKLDATINPSKSKSPKIISLTIETNPTTSSLQSSDSTNLDVSEHKQNSYNLSKSLQKQAKLIPSGSNIINLESLPTFSEINTMNKSARNEQPLIFKPISNKQDVILAEGINIKSIEPQLTIIRPVSTDSLIKIKPSLSAESRNIHITPMTSQFHPSIPVSNQTNLKIIKSNVSKESIQIKEIATDSNAKFLKTVSIDSQNIDSLPSISPITPTTSRLKPSTLVSTQSESSFSVEYKNLIPSTSQFIPSTPFSTQPKTSLSTECRNVITSSTSQLKPSIQASPHSNSTHTKSSLSTECRNISSSASHFKSPTLVSSQTNSPHTKSSLSTGSKIIITPSTSQLIHSTLESTQSNSTESKSSLTAESRNIITPSHSHLKPPTLVSSQTNSSHTKSSLSPESKNILTPQLKPSTLISTQSKSTLSAECRNIITSSTSQLKLSTLVSSHSDSIESKLSLSAESRNIITPSTSQVKLSIPISTPSKSSLSAESITPTTSQLQLTLTPVSTLSNFKIIQPDCPQSDIQITEIKTSTDDVILEILNTFLNESQLQATDSLSNSKSITSQSNFRIVEPFVSQNNIQFTEVKNMIPPESHVASESHFKAIHPSTNDPNLKINQPTLKPTPLSIKPGPSQSNKKLSSSSNINQNLPSSEPNLKMVKSVDSLQLKSFQADSSDNGTPYSFKTIKIKQPIPSTSSVDTSISDFITIHSSKVNAESLTGSKINTSKSFVTLSVPKSLLARVNTSQLLKSQPEPANTSDNLSKTDNPINSPQSLLKPSKSGPPPLSEKFSVTDELQTKDTPNTSSITSESDNKNSNTIQITLNPKKMFSPKTYSRKSQPIINKILKSLNQENSTTREKTIETSNITKGEIN